MYNFECFATCPEATIATSITTCEGTNNSFDIFPSLFSKIVQIIAKSVLALLSVLSVKIHILCISLNALLLVLMQHLPKLQRHARVSSSILLLNLTFSSQIVLRIATIVLPLLYALNASVLLSSTSLYAFLLAQLQCLIPIISAKVE